MIFHLESAGVPVSWTIVAAYKSSYGIAYNAAKSWQEREIADRAADLARNPHRSEYLANEPARPHFIVEIDNDTFAVKRSDLLMDEAHLKQQKSGSNWLIQAHSAPTELTGEMVAALTTALTRALTEFGYFIPRDEWERRYPAQKLISDHFQAFSQAHKAFRDSRDADNQDPFPFELRFAPYMEAPAGFTFPYGVMQQQDPVTRKYGAWLVTHDGISIDELQPTSEEQAETMMRLLNSGYRIEDIPILLAKEPAR